MNEVCAVERDQIATVSRLLEKHGNGSRLYRDIWELGINVALRISDLLALRMVEVVDREMIEVRETKTGKTRQITLNERAKAVIARRAAEFPEDIWLFQSKSNRAKAAIKPIRREMVARKFKEVGEILDLALATHSMRKTRGKAMFEAGVPIEQICKVLNHSSPTVTLRYIGIDRERVAQTYEDFVL